VHVEQYSSNDIPAEHLNLDHALPDESSLLGGNLDYNPETDEDPNCAECDSTAEAWANALADKLLQSINDPVIQSRVLGDIWHLMDQFKISVHHGLCFPFARAL
jgi:hypothetical protein